MEYGERIELTNGDQAIWLNEWTYKGATRYLIKTELGTTRHVKPEMVKTKHQIIAEKSLAERRCEVGDFVEYACMGREGTGIVERLFVGTGSNKKKSARCEIRLDSGKLIEVPERCVFKVPTPLEIAIGTHLARQNWSAWDHRRPRDKPVVFEEIETGNWKEFQFKERF